MSARAVSAKQGFVLVMALWALGFLAVLALSIGLGTRQKIVLLGRLENRSQAQFAAEAGVKKAVAVLLDDLEKNQLQYSPAAKARRHNNAAELGNIPLGGMNATVFCPSADEVSGQFLERPGLCDEAGKLNINKTDVVTLTRLVARVLGLDDEKSRGLAGGIIDWRDYGQSEATGFFSDDYYKNLEYPYDMKSQPFERIDELLLVKGVDKNIYSALRPFVTIYGDGRININTVSKEVLCALGVDGDLADKLLKARRGQDNLAATADDHVFLNTFDVPVDVNTLVALTEPEARQLDALNTAELLRTDSLIFSLVARSSDGNKTGRVIEAVFDAAQNKYLFWYEK
ncbi:MAG: general secretion pathway protein GspK [Candidatus Omnitrophica bacterium]|nr:general secretion pathway protein GspK [Candidatus Omnitrophota bacterium]